MNNQEIDEMMKQRERAITDGMLEIAKIKGSSSLDGMMTAVGSVLQTIAILLAEQVKRMPEQGSKDGVHKL